MGLTMNSVLAVQTPVTRLIDEHGKCVARIAELEAALREIAGGEISGHGEIVVRSDSMTIAHEALEKE